MAHLLRVYGVPLEEWEWAGQSNRRPLGTTTRNIPVLNIDCGKVKALGLALTTEEFPADFVSLNDLQVDPPSLTTW